MGSITFLQSCLLEVCSLKGWDYFQTLIPDTLAAHYCCVHTKHVERKVKRFSKISVLLTLLKVVSPPHPSQEIVCHIFFLEEQE